MNNDRLIVISTGTSRRSMTWQKTEMLWSEFVAKIQTPQRTQETLAEYFKLTKAKQGALKDIGGFVGGALNGNQRKASAVVTRDLVTLDMDNIANGETKNVLKKVNSLGIAYAIYSTRSHAEFKPRLRVIIPLDKSIGVDEYEPVARKLAALIGIEMCDPTTFEASRLMYWPGCSQDSNYVFDFSDSPFVSAEGLLKQYDNWKDIRTWPQVPGEAMKAKVVLSRQADPTTKAGIVGAFCKTYNVYAAIDSFLPHAYEATDKADRLTYTGGTTVAGAVVYDNGNFLFSHHATDPCSGQLVNAFDLVRLHKFSELDGEALPGTPINKLPSFREMKHLALSDKTAANTFNTEMAAKASDVFKPQGEVEEVLDVNWIEAAKLTYDTNTGLPKKTRDNIIRILNFDPELKDKIATDEFAVRGLALGALPWDERTEMREWTDTDDAGLAWYLENRWDLQGRDKIESALLLVSDQHKFNAVSDYLKELKWDKKPRLDTLLRDYLGAEDTPYTRGVSRKAFTAAVARALSPGCKYDYVPVLVGPQGIGKTTFLATMGKSWYSDSLQTFDGKEAAEMIQGIWLNELGEMTGYNRSEQNSVKQFLSKRDDIYRQAYGRRTQRYPRKCVFFGTCNEFEFLKDETGNRRFWPIDCGTQKSRKSIWEDLPKEVDQIWAEAVVRYRLGEPLYFPGASESIVKAEQDKHSEQNAKTGLIKQFLEKEVPEDYTKMSLGQRRIFWGGNLSSELKLVPREKVCALEVWCECLNGDLKFMKKADATEINQILNKMDGWSRNKATRNYGYCGYQRGYEKG